MSKKHFEDLEMSATIVEFFYIILKIFSIVEIVGSVVGGVILWVRFSPLYGVLLLVLGSLSGVIGLIVTWLSNIVLNCFLDSACATKELYDVSSKKGMLKETTGILYIIQNVKKNEYISNIVDDGVASSPNIDDAMLFHTKQEAERVVHDFGLSKDDGWYIEQAKI